MSDEFYNFDEALDQLNLKEEELKRLVSEGEIRAFREGDTMKLRKQDVESLRGELMGGEVVDLQGAGDEIVFEDDLDLEETGMATEEISEMDTLLEEDVPDVEEEIDFEERASPAPRAAAVRRSAPQKEEDPEGPFVRIVAILTTLILILSMSVVIAISRGVTGGLAGTLTEMFSGSDAP